MFALARAIDEGRDRRLGRGKIWGYARNTVLTGSHSERQVAPNNVPVDVQLLELGKVYPSLVVRFARFGIGTRQFGRLFRHVQQQGLCMGAGANDALRGCIASRPVGE